MKKGDCINKIQRAFDESGITYISEEIEDVIEGKKYNKTISIGTKDRHPDYDGIGYCGFFTVFYFLDEELVCHGEWE